VNRGDVYLIPLRLPDRQTPGQFEVRNKLAVILRAADRETDVPFLIASSHDESQRARAFEVIVGVAEGFKHETVIDCRWPYTLPKTWFERGRYLFTLPERTMRDVATSLVVGLQM
jgi:hypothetical protein